MESVSVFVSVLSISVSPVFVVSVPVTSVPVPVIQLLIFALVPVVVFTVCAASVTPVLSGRCSAAVSASVRGLAPQAPSGGGVSGLGLTGALLQAGGAQGVEEEALVGAPQRAFQPDRGSEQTHLFQCDREG